MDIKPEDIDYSLHYKNWHNDDTRENDISYYSHYLERHNLYPEKMESNILEIGCGFGNLLTSLLRKGYEKQIGIDIDSSQIEHCKKYGLNVEHISSSDFFYESKESFDSIFLFDVLEHMPKPEQLSLLRDIFNALSDDGIFALSVPNALTPLASYFENIDWTHYCCFSPVSLSFVLKNSGFRYIVLRPTHKESSKLRELKKPWIDLYKEEFQIDNPILTPSIVAVCFKSEKAMKKYLENAEDLMKFDYVKRSIFHRVKNKIRALVSK
ncbi:class I SAM-dependent methyltransferase [Vibrio mangrovi]|uniref:Bifunctional 3-demethylubiquinone-9 3-methyltransferase/ 2-octaprenyl-6-hydroxy phenol methylase n=1 Tax=Vibrio mangrovi TaxID=474394 RepID=A0A1Y6IV37_9VIBR|nr:class I SAM-dependent methyltransferase [Vibrio mangrovi]MDW6002194.1 class I SAM-dependent methyltransferase [Vibrio mangrovi]SMS01539.1 bifunctional 3-demethylubiquinone-9 3-methyltransferase/ 2-octaprenyl-6-hydroxy phenol methylase [Vibrio mangrovi]